MRMREQQASERALLSSLACCAPSQQDHHFRVSWKTGGSTWWRQAPSLLSASSYSHWQPKFLHRSLPDAVMPGAAFFSGGTSRTSMPEVKQAAGVSEDVRYLYCLLVNGDPSLMQRTSSSSSSGYSGNFLL